jgi:hypothetical protein
MTGHNASLADAPPLNLVKLAVGIESPEHLARVQKRRLDDARKAGRAAVLCHVTRNRPRRSADLLAGGSIYWVIKGRLRVRQRLLDIVTDTDPEGRRICRLVLAPRLVAVEPRRQRAFQGWRYLAHNDAPPDLAADAAGSALPGELATELRELGLL